MSAAAAAGGGERCAHPVAGVADGVQGGWPLAARGRLRGQGERTIPKLRTVLTKLCKHALMQTFTFLYLRKRTAWSITIAADHSRHSWCYPSSRCLQSKFVGVAERARQAKEQGKPLRPLANPLPVDLHVHGGGGPTKAGGKGSKGDKGASKAVLEKLAVALGAKVKLLQSCCAHCRSAAWLDSAAQSKSGHTESACGTAAPLPSCCVLLHVNRMPQVIHADSLQPPCSGMRSWWGSGSATTASSAAAAFGHRPSSPTPWQSATTGCCLWPRA